MTLVSEVLDIARGHLGDDRDERNRLDGAYTAVGTSLTFEFDMGSIQRGALIGVELEEFHTWSVSGQTATVSGAQNGSTAANHADNTVVRVNPGVTDFSLFRALNEELQALSAKGLVAVKQLNLTATGATTGYDLTGTTTVLEVRQVNRESAGSGKNWPALRRSEFRLDTKADTAVFASGNALMVYAGVDVGKKIRVWYDAPLTVVTGLTQNIETITGLHAEAHDILSMGIALRRMVGRPIRRANTDAQGDPRRAEEVGTGDVLNSTSRLKALYEDRINQELTRLTQRYPFVS